ncbi:DNA helicase/exodeoxyribonuclease V, gamma subunit [Pseudidiomarina maritima]|uniref:RecBCD enzyme subunit RecC n=1 Tax=Pseudidiomarina maritima TaxID=519453 RepID=A0A1I6H511_9GAMM|nr:exodeoxyribonuclease V subunit gamma [Pseudidiomarina maritima]SFR49538.1 DNA helicase/exodeoxyribonuclease V, gamma subunit [Pseudidiomarina maritima]
MSQLTPGFIVAHSHRLQDLTDLVISINRQYPIGALDNETILVQSNGIAQWLKQHLARDLGIAAMVDVTLPARFQWQAYRAILGHDLPRHSPFDKDRLTWRILRLLPEHLDEPEFAPLRRYMADDQDQRKCFQLSERLADLYDQYQIYRADWLSDWANGGAMAATDEQAWQPKLWRYLLADVGDSRWNNRAYLHQQFIESCRQRSAQQRPHTLPPRVIVFGISSLPKQTLEVLQALSRFTQVVLCVHNPCQYYWADIIDGKDIYDKEVKARQQRRHQQSINPDELHAYSHPLLASWGKQGRDYIRLLDSFDETDQLRPEFPALKLDLFEQPVPDQPSILDAIRYDILHLNSPSEAQTQWQNVSLDDGAIQFHCAHSPQREVEILHDQLLARFAADPDLKPRDVMVMVPDIDQYAPHIDAVFGRYERSDARCIPYSLADQGARHQHPMLIALEYVLTISQQRASASELFDLLQVSAIQRRFGLREDQLATLQRWIDASGVRWALDEQHRQQLGLPPVRQNTWLFGLQRMLFGYAVGATEGFTPGWQNIEPLVDVGGLDADIVGALQQFLMVINEHFEQASQPRTPAQWASYLNDLLGRLFLPEADADVVLLNKLQQRLQQWLDATQSAALEIPVSITVVLESWLSQVDEPSLNQRFLAGRVNFATLMPMRAIPFKYVCLLGMNDGDYPRTQKPFDFDLMAHDYRPGDRSRREDDRYLFLEAILAAQQLLYISWQGRNIRDNSEKPPSVLVSQLLEHIQQVYGKRRDQSPWIIEHRLQPFHRAYFQASQPQSNGLFSFAEEWHVVHHGEPTAAPAVGELSAWLPPRALTVKQVSDFLKESAKLFTQVRLNTYLQEQTHTLRDEERFALTGLERWQLLQPTLHQVLRQLRDEHDVSSAEATIIAMLARYQRAGELPIGASGRLMQEDLVADTQGLLERANELLIAFPEPVDTLQIIQQFDQGLVLEATFSTLQKNRLGEHLWLQVTPSVVVDNKRKVYRPRAEHTVQLWVEHLLLNSRQATRSCLLGREGSIQFAPLPQASALTLLETLMQWVYRGLQEPLPLEIKTAFEGIKENHKDWQQAAVNEVFDALNSKAQEFYDNGGYNQTAQKFVAVYTARYFPDYASLTAAETFNAMVQALYQPMLQHVFESLPTAEEHA